MRKRETIAVNPTRQAVRASPNPMVDVARNSAGMLAKRAAQYAQGMAVAAEDEAKALVKNAVFSTGPSGMPQMPPDPTKRMGEIAQKSYLLGIEDRYAHQLNTSIQAQINDARNANLYDLDAFVEDAEGRLSAMSQEIPEGMEGMFQQISTGLMVDAGAGIGYRVAMENLADAKAQFPLQVASAITSTHDLIMGGNDDAAKANVEHMIELINNQNAEVIRDDQKAAYVEQIIQSIAHSRLSRDFDLGNATPAQLQALTDSLLAGDNDELLRTYFTRPGESVGDPQMAQAAANYVRGFMGGANKRQSDQDAQDLVLGRVDDFGSGWAADTAQNRAAGDRVVAQALGWTTPATPQSWLELGNGDPDDRHRAMEVVKNAGILPDSLAKVFTRLDRTQNPDEIAAAFLVYRDLQEQPNKHGRVINMAGEVPERLTAIFEMADVLHGDGGPSQESVSQAISLWETMDPNWDDKDFANAISADGTFAKDGWFGSGRVSEDNVRERVRSAVMNNIFDGVDATSKEKDQAVRLFETYVRVGNDPEDAMSMAKQSMNKRWVETKYMAGFERSTTAPEKWFARPAATSLGEAVKHIWGDIVGSPKPFDILASDHIKEMIESQSDPFLKEAFIKSASRNPAQLLLSGELLTGHTLKAGVDYKLTTDPSSGVPPKYYVKMRGPRGTWVPLSGTLDVRADYEAMVEMDWLMAAHNEAKDNRAKKYVQSRGATAILEAIQNGEDPSYLALVRKYREIMEKE